MSDKEDPNVRMELLSLRHAILKKYQAPHPDSSSLGDDPSPFCSFCGKARNQVGGMVGSGLRVYICNECVTIAHDILFGPRSDHVHE
jgi:hypothetical protein